MSRPARIKTAKDAYNDGYATGNDGSGMMAHGTAWPSQTDFDNKLKTRDPFIAQWLNGWTAGREDRRLDDERMSMPNPKRKTMKRRKHKKRSARRGGRVMTVTTSSRVVKTTRMNPSYGSDHGFNIAVATLTDGSHLFMTKSGQWKPIVDIRKVKPARFSGGIPNAHFDRLIRSSVGNRVAQTGAEPYPEMPNLARSNPRGLSLEPYRRSFKFGRDRHRESISFTHSSKNTRNMMRVLFPTWTKEQHVERLVALSHLIHVAGGVWGRIADKAHAEAFPGKRRGFADYKVSGVGRDEYPERLKAHLRVASRQQSTISSAIHAHALMAGNAALRRAGITESAMTSYRNNPHDPRTAQTQRLPAIRVMIPAGSKDPRTAETRRLRVVTSSHRKNPVRSLVVPRRMWKHLKRADKCMKHGHRYVRCKTRRARRAFWLPCTIR